jgi:hypothetical protein
VARKKSAVLTDKQKDFADAKILGASTKQAMRDAGYAPTNVDIEKRSAEVQAYINDARQGLVDATTLTRLDVIQGILDAIADAKLMAEPATMIAGYAQLAKIMGFYQPEVKKLDITINGARVRHKMETMTDEELLELTNGTVLEGEFVREHSVN